MKNLIFLCVVLASSLNIFTAASRSDDLWGPLNFLVGDWNGEGGGKPGQGPGNMSVTWDLDRQVMINKGHSEYPASKDRPATVHDSLMIIFKDPSGEKLRATYFDNEGHVIQYAIEASENPVTIRFVSDALPSTPRFRLTYIRRENNMDIKFEIAPPGKPDAFTAYVEGTVRRK
jgi:hypothetical protein